MVTELDADLADIEGLIKDEVGTDAVFKVITSGGVYDVATSKSSAEVTADVTWKITPPKLVNPMLVDHDLIQVGDMETIISAVDLTFTPLVAQRVVYRSQTWRIVAVDPVPSGDLICVYELRLRKGAGG